MARPIKSGLDYFPLDIDFFNDDKIAFVSARFEEKGELIAIKLLCRIYKNGYFINWNDDTALLFAKSAGKNITNGLVKDVVDELLKRDFFNKSLYMRFKILTSKGIQERYELICKSAKRKTQIDERFRINTELTNVNSEETNINSRVNITKEIKEKERKLNESKYKLSLDFIKPEFSEIFNLWLDYKKSRRESYKNDHSLKLCYDGLIKKSKNDPETARKIVERSMENNWAGLFELNTEYQKKFNVNQSNVNQHATAEEYTSRA